MIWNPFKIAPKSFLGIDIGTFSIKIVEMSHWGRKKKLENYGEIQAETLYEKPFRVFEKNTLTVSRHDVVRAILAILDEAKIKSKIAYFSIPDFSTFFTTFNLPPMTEEELPQAVTFEARQHTPLPLSEVTLDWQIIEGKAAPQKSTPFKILLVVVPNEIINQYQEIAKAVQLELRALEAEVFGLSRSLIKDLAPASLIDIGARSTTINIIDKGLLRTSHSFDTSGNDLTDLISKGVNVDYKTAEELKKKYGIVHRQGGSDKGGIEKDVALTQLPLIDLILKEIEKISQNFYQTEGGEVQKVILAGGSALLPGLSDYFAESLKKPVEIANPFSDIYYPPVLEDTLKKMGPSYAIATGTALRGLE